MSGATNETKTPQVAGCVGSLAPGGTLRDSEQSHLLVVADRLDPGPRDASEIADGEVHGLQPVVATDPTMTP
jgi:hypothetical protein